MGSNSSSKSSKQSTNQGHHKTCNIGVKMSASVISSNVGLKVNRAIGGATTVNANCYAIVNYQSVGYVQGYIVVGFAEPTVITRYFGPAQAVPAIFSVFNDPDLSNVGGVAELRFSIFGGVEFINSP